MNSVRWLCQSKKSLQSSLVAFGGILLLLGSVSLANADDPESTSDYVNSTSSAAAAPNEANVFNWTEVPQNQQVPIVRATFDQGGYQLFDSVGETIMVPFAGDNLYIMKFSQTSADQMYFVNDGGTPTLYVPSGGYLENATVAGAKWYPFPENFPSDDPIYLGMAPSWDAYLNMGWYPDMSCYGGFCCDTSLADGGDFESTINLCYEIGGVQYFGWSAYNRYCLWHHPFSRIGFGNRDYHRWGDQPRFDRSFAGGLGGSRGFNGGGRFFHERSTGRTGETSANRNSDHSFAGARSTSAPVFHGEHSVVNGGAGYGGQSNRSTGHHFRGAIGAYDGGRIPFSGSFGSRGYGGTSPYSASHNFSGAVGGRDGSGYRSEGGSEYRSFSAPAYGGFRNFGGFGGNSGGGGFRTFSAAPSGGRAYSGGMRSYGGGGGERSFSSGGGGGFRSAAPAVGGARTERRR